MCIRDRVGQVLFDRTPLNEIGMQVVPGNMTDHFDPRANICLLYTSDAADERSSVDLGGRRIIKKKNNTKEQHE